MLFIEYCTLKWKISVARINGIVSTKNTHFFLPFLSPTFHMKRCFYLFVLFFKRMILYDLEIQLLKVNTRILL
jgi:hypothetical protein